MGGKSFRFGYGGMGGYGVMSRYARAQADDEEDEKSDRDSDAELEGKVKEKDSDEEDDSDSEIRRKKYKHTMRKLEKTSTLDSKRQHRAILRLLAQNKNEHVRVQGSGVHFVKSVREQEVKEFFGKFVGCEVGFFVI